MSITIRMTSADAAAIAAAKVEASKLFGHDRLVAVSYDHPVTGEPLVEVLIAALSFAEASAYYDELLVDQGNARSKLLAERVMWPAGDVLADVREEWPAFDVMVEARYREAHGFTLRPVTLQPQVLTMKSKPAVMDKSTVEQLLATNPGKLWWAEYAPNGFGWAWRAPIAEMWSMSTRLISEASSEGRGQLCPILDIANDHTVWTATGGSLKQHVASDMPGRAALVDSPWTLAGGAAAKTSARFL